jgi:hypothetical protein
MQANEEFLRNITLIKNYTEIFSDGVPAGLYEQPPCDAPEPFPADAALDSALEQAVENAVEAVDDPADRADSK